jgi:DNA-binding beta-propeller fold protein YncE
MNQQALQDELETTSRRRFMSSICTSVAAGYATVAVGALGCSTDKKGPQFKTDLVVGQRGLSEGRFQKPRAIAIDPKTQQLYVIDKTARIQVFDADGVYLRGWETPMIEQGKPTGISIDVDGTILVADTHYFRFLFYTPNGELLEEKTIGGINGPDPGQFAFVTDIVRAKTGEYILGEYGEFDRIYKYSSDGKYITRFGQSGEEPLQFRRPQSLAIDEQGLLWIADDCNHRIQVLDWRGEHPELVKVFGSEGADAGQLKHPRSIALTQGHVIVSEYGNHRVQKFDRDGNSVAIWGSVGRGLGELIDPWAIAVDALERVYVVDSGNNRVQRFRFT